MISDDTHIRCLNCGTVWVRVGNPDILNDYLNHQPCQPQQHNNRALHPSNWESR